MGRRYNAELWVTRGIAGPPEFHDFQDRRTKIDPKMLLFLFHGTYFPDLL
jgi:hypothetical protein